MAHQRGGAHPTDVKRIERLRVEAAASQAAGRMYNSEKGWILSRGDRPARVGTLEWMALWASGFTVPTGTS